MKKIFVLLLIASIAASGVSCKFIKKKFGKQEEVVADSTSVGEGEFVDDGSSSDFSDAELLADSSTSTSTDAGTDALTSADTKSSEEAEKSAETAPAPAPAKTEKQVAKAEPKPAASPAKSTATATAKAKTSSNTATAATATTTPRRRSGSIYDGVNDQEERAIIRRAEGYNDAYYVDDYNGSNSEYERHYKKASELDGSKDYIVPASGYADGRQTGPARGPKKALPNTPAHSQPAAKASNATNANNASANGQIGTVPTKVEQKPKTANEIIQKK